MKIIEGKIIIYWMFSWKLFLIKKLIKNDKNIEELQEKIGISPRKTKNYEIVIINCWSFLDSPKLFSNILEQILLEGLTIKTNTQNEKICTLNEIFLEDKV